jgi:hypothetical protein
MKTKSLNSTSTTAEGHAAEARRYLKWNVLRSSVEQRLAYAQVQATLAVYEELKAARDAQR